MALQMKLGDAGEAFFVEEIEEPERVPEDYVTSPIQSSTNLMEDKKEVQPENIADIKVC